MSWLVETIDANGVMLSLISFLCALVRSQSKTVGDQQYPASILRVRKSYWTVIGPRGILSVPIMV